MNTADSNFYENMRKIKSMTAVTRFARVSLMMFSASAAVFRERIYQGIVAVSVLVFFGMYLLVPVWLIPGDTFALEFAQMKIFNYGLLFALALMTGALLALEFFAFRRSRIQGFRAVSKSGVGVAASLAGGILTVASCGCGTGILLGVLGLGGGAFFVAANQTAIAAVMLAVVAVGLYFSARRAAGICATCRVE